MKKNILVIGRHSQILETVVRLINSQPDMKAIGVLSDDEAKKVFGEQTFDLVLIGGGVEEESEVGLKIFFERVNPGIKIIKHYGGGSGLLFNEIAEAMATK